MIYDGPTVFTDWYIFSNLVDKVKSNLKIAWLVEPSSIHPRMYQQIHTVSYKFDYIFTFDDELLQSGPKFKRTLIGALRINDKDIKLYTKTKLVSIIASEKNITEGHKLRHIVINKYKDIFNIDVWGRAYNPFENKLTPLSEYAFSIIILNTREKNYFNEALMDCLAVGTIPIFWGCNNIDEFFNIKGFLIFETLQQLENILKNISFEKYNNMLEYVKDNLEKVYDYVSTDDLFAKELQKLL
jgi:hypothetical protein